MHPSKCRRNARQITKPAQSGKPKGGYMPGNNITVELKGKKVSVNTATAALSIASNRANASPALN